jgi:signal transduction histidine kinase
MSVDSPAALESRVLFLRDHQGAQALVRDAVRKAGLTPETCDGMNDLCEKALQGAAAAVLASDLLDAAAIERLQKALHEAPDWSELPIILLKAKKVSTTTLSAKSDPVLNFEGVVVLHEPVASETLTSVLRSAARDRRRQYELRDLLSQWQTASNRFAALTEQLESFAHTVSHDLRAPLRAIRGFAQALSEDYSGSLDATGREYLHRMGQGAERLDHLIQDLLKYSRLARGAITLAPVKLSAALDRVRLQLEPEIEASRASIQTTTSLPSVMAHEPTLLQVLSALLSNALKFVAPGVKPQIRVWSSASGANTRLWISDNGIGIAPHHQDRIFGVFERLHSAEVYPGTGMGLAVVSKGMTRMGGSFGLESAPGEGSRFWIELPRA